MQLYGQTEGVIYASRHEISMEDIISKNEMASIGRPLKWWQCLIVDEFLQPVIPGQAGEFIFSSKYIYDTKFSRAFQSLPN